MAKRNRWFIRVRYMVVVMLSVFILTAHAILGLDFTDEQSFYISVIIVAILFYNLIFNFIFRKDLIKDDRNKFNQLHFSFFQILFDILCLSFLVYFTGGIESPFYLFYIFHMIIGSMILPGFLIYSIAGTIVFQMILFGTLELFGVVKHYSIGNFLPSSAYNNPAYLFISLSVFGIMIIVSVFLANNIASAHYRREQELKLALEKISESEKIKQRYTMGVVHEIKTPIVAVQSNLDLVLQGFTGEINNTAKEKLARARSRSDEAINIINDILSISKLKLLEKINNEEFDIGTLLYGIIVKRKAQIDLKKIKVSLSDKRKDRPNIIADKSLLEVAFSNLIGNAIKYNTEGGIVEITIEDGDYDNINIEVCDDGIGIPDKDKDKIFMDFFRASNVKKTGTEGTGLGLSVVKQIIEQHNGSLTFESPSRLSRDNRRGTSFLVSLPVK